jgi:hypothetical protein
MMGAISRASMSFPVCIMLWQVANDGGSMGTLEPGEKADSKESMLMIRSLRFDELLRLPLWVPENIREPCRSNCTISRLHEPSLSTSCCSNATPPIFQLS